MMWNGMEMHLLKGATKRKYAHIILLCRKYGRVYDKEGEKENLMREDCRVGVS